LVLRGTVVACLFYLNLSLASFGCVISLGLKVVRNLFEAGRLTSALRGREGTALSVVVVPYTGLAFGGSYAPVGMRVSRKKPSVGTRVRGIYSPPVS